MTRFLIQCAALIGITWSVAACTVNPADNQIQPPYDQIRLRFIENKANFESLNSAVVSCQGVHEFNMYPTAFDNQFASSHLPCADKVRMILRSLGISQVTQTGASPQLEEIDNERNNAILAKPPTTSAGNADQQAIYKKAEEADETYKHLSLYITMYFERTESKTLMGCNFSQCRYKSSTTAIFFCDPTEVRCLPKSNFETTKLIVKPLIEGENWWYVFEQRQGYVLQQAL